MCQVGRGEQHSNTPPKRRPECNTLHVPSRNKTRLGGNAGGRAICPAAPSSDFRSPICRHTPWHTPSVRASWEPRMPCRRPRLPCEAAHPPPASARALQSIAILGTAVLHPMDRSTADDVQMLWGGVQLRRLPCQGRCVDLSATSCTGCRTSSVVQDSESTLRPYVILPLPSLATTEPPPTPHLQMRTFSQSAYGGVGIISATTRAALPTVAATAPHPASEVAPSFAGEAPSTYTRRGTPCRVVRVTLYV